MVQQGVTCRDNLHVFHLEAAQFWLHLKQVNIWPGVILQMLPGQGENMRNIWFYLNYEFYNSFTFTRLHQLI